MDARRLATFLEQSEVQDQILNSYEGGFAMGLMPDPNNPARYAIRVRIEGNDTSLIARSITLNGEQVRVLIETGFRVPRPLTG